MKINICKQNKVILFVVFPHSLQNTCLSLLISAQFRKKYLYNTYTIVNIPQHNGWGLQNENKNR